MNAEPRSTRVRLRRALPSLALFTLFAACDGADADRAAVIADTAAVSASAPGEVGAGPVSLTVREGLQMPESAPYDEVADLYVVSNVNGGFGAKDDNGFISRIAPDGRVAELKWIDGADPDVTLNGPTGIAFKGDTLLVVDIDAVRLFDRSSGAPIGAWEIPGATFLNDITVGADGTVYVTDTAIQTQGDSIVQSGTDAIYRFGPDGTPTAIAKGAELNGPNGIVATPDGLLIATFNGNEVYRLDASGNRTPVAQLPQGQLDGLVRLADGTLLVTSWAGKAVYRVDAGGNATAVVENVTSPASIGYDSRRNRVIVPLVQENQVRIESLVAPQR